MKSLYVKLAKAIDELPAMVKDTKGYNYKFFDINQMIKVIRPIFKKNGLLFLQPLSNVEGKPAITTKIIELETGELIEDTFVFPDNSDPQKQGSTITYNRRYVLQSFLGLEAEDDDGKKVTAKDTLTKNHANYDKVKSYIENGGDIKEVEKKYILTADIKKQLHE